MKVHNKMRFHRVILLRVEDAYSVACLNFKTECFAKIAKLEPISAKWVISDIRQGSEYTSGLGTEIYG